jgi:peroxiredoxin
VSEHPAPERASPRPRWRRIAEWAVLVAALIPFTMRFGPQLLAAVGGPAFGGLVGRTAPDIAVTTLAGEPVSLAALRGKVVVVNFWAPWCGPCRLEMPAFQRAFERDSSRGLVVLGLSQDRDPQVPVSVFLAERGLSYPVAMSTLEIDRAFGGVNLLPTTILIDRRGTVRHVVRGYFAEPALRLAVGKLLDES